MAVVGGLQAQIKSTFWTSGEPIIKYCPGRLSLVKQTRALKCIVPTYTLQITRLAVDHEPRSSSSTSNSTAGTAVVVPANKGWTNAMGLRDQRLVNQLNGLVDLASDRVEMHSILATQRDNWNLLFHSTITIASVSAAAAAAINGAEQALGLSVVASILGLGVAALMALVNKFQPSQLADEQRHAARFFKHLETDISATLETDPRLCGEASQFWEQKVGTLHALDKAFPLPLTPMILERFPKVVRPSILSGPSVDLATPEERTSSDESSNGWTSGTENELKRTSELLHTSDIPTCIDMASTVNHINKVLATTSPLLALSGALCSMVDAMVGMHMISGLGAAFTVAAFFVHSMSHALQLGAAFETYRNCAGYYADMEKSIERNLRLPREQREDGILFLQKILMQLGRSPAQSSLVPLKNQKRAGTLF